MNEVFDPTFENTRLRQLTEQCLSETIVSGEVIFGCSGEINYLNFATWFFDDPTYNVLTESGFKTYLMNLLNDLITYRSSFDQEFSRNGIVTLENSSASIKWIKYEDAERLINYKKSLEQ